MSAFIQHLKPTRNQRIQKHPGHDNHWKCGWILLLHSRHTVLNEILLQPLDGWYWKHQDLSGDEENTSGSHDQQLAHLRFPYAPDGIYQVDILI